VDEEEAVDELGRERRWRTRQRHRAGDVLAQGDLRRAGQERRHRGIARNPVELGHVVDDAIELIHQAGQVFLLHGQLRQAGDVQDFIATDAHALSHSRSRPA
jgi:hypothetical protein